MRSNCGETAKRLKCACLSVGITLTAMLFAQMAGAQTQSAEQKPAEQRVVPGSYQIFYLSNATRQMDMNDIQTDLRNMLPRAKVYGVQTQNAISIQGSADDLALAQKMIADLDRPRKVYRLVYSITEVDGGKRVGTQHFSLIALSGGRTILKQGSRVPIVTGTYEAGTPKQNSQVQYQDVGLSIEATLDGESLHSKVEQTSPAEERSGVGPQDPIVRQTVLDGMSSLTLGKSVVLGSFDIPGSTRHQEVEVASELVK
jgi:type II secretory pathway component GspD/PulD (secretin)